MTTYEPALMSDGPSAEISELHRLLSLGAPALVGKNASERIELPDVIYRILKETVSNLKSGKSVVLIPETAELTTQTAANLLGVSRPHFIKLLETGAIPFTKTGSHRRVRLADVQAYDQVRSAERSKILNDLAKQALQDGYYEGTPIPDGGEDE